MIGDTMAREDLRLLPPVLDVTSAARVLGMGKSTAYDLIKSGQWPTPILHLGKMIRIPTDPLLRLVHPTDSQDRAGPT